MNKELKICGEIPNVRLCRFFSKEDYARQFVNGSVRFGWQKNALLWKVTSEEIQLKVMLRF